MLRILDGAAIAAVWLNVFAMLLRVRKFIKADENAAVVLALLISSALVYLVLRFVGVL